MASPWMVNLLERTATHRETGLILRFTAAMDGSGAMQIDPVNPEVLSSYPQDGERKKLASLPYEAWNIYAQASETALQNQQTEEG